MGFRSCLLGGMQIGSQVAVSTSLRQPKFSHQVNNLNPGLSFPFQLPHGLLRQSPLPPKRHTASLRFLDTFQLTLGTDFRLKLSNRSKHVEEQAAGRIARVDILIEHLQLNALFPEPICNLAEMEGRARQAIKARDDEKIAFANEVEASLESRPGSRSPTASILVDLIAMGQTVQLHFQTLSDRTHACIANDSHRFCTIFS